jgi:hypothetical protein
MQMGTGNRQLLFLYERGKKKLMDGARINFGGDSFDIHILELSLGLLTLVAQFLKKSSFELKLE